MNNLFAKLESIGTENSPLMLVKVVLAREWLPTDLTGVHFLA